LKRLIRQTWVSEKPKRKNKCLLTKILGGPQYELYKVSRGRLANSATRKVSRFGSSEGRCKEKLTAAVREGQGGEYRSDLT